MEEKMVHGKLRTLVVITILCISFNLKLNAQTTKVFETKIGIYNWDEKDFKANENLSYIAGSSKYCVFQSNDGKIITDKTYSDMGIQVDAVEALFSESLDKLVFWGNADKKTKGLYCVDVKSGTKLWESVAYSNSFNEYSSVNIILIGKYVIIRENQKNQNTPYLIIDINTGKTTWTYLPGKEMTEFSNFKNFSNYNMLGVFKAKPKSNSVLFDLYDLSNGKRLDSLSLQGQYLTNCQKGEMIYIHHYMSTKESYITCYNLKDKKKIWQTKAAIKTYDYAPENVELKIFDNNVFLIAQGIEAFDAGTGNSKYSIKTDLAFNNSSQFSPKNSDNGLLVANFITSEIKMYNKENGTVNWTLKEDGSNAPDVLIYDKSAIVSFGGLAYDLVSGFKVFKITNPKSITSVDLLTGNILWKTPMKKDFYFVTDMGENIMVVGVKELITLDKKTGTIQKTEKNPFDSSYYYPDKDGKMKDASIDYALREVYLFDAGYFSKSTF